MIKFLQFFVLLIFSTMLVKSQNSYVYIEGIKGIPFNVTCDNKDVAKLGKGYCILTFTAPGEKTIDISFANTNFSKQRFILDVQANSSYGFRMGKTDENKFYLIDIVNEGKIIETNTPVNLALSTDKNIINFYKPKVVAVSIDSTKSGNEEQEEDVKPSKKKHKAQKEETQESEIVSIPSQVEATVDSAIEKQPPTKLAKRTKKKNKTEEVIQTPTETSKEEKYGVVEVIPPVSKPINSIETKIEKNEPSAPAKVVKQNNCTKTASDEEINSIIAKLSEKEDDEAKLLLIKKRIVSGCYTSKQVYNMAENFDTQYGRYTLIRFVYPLTADPSNLMTLESLFKYEAYKLKLKKIIENP